MPACVIADTDRKLGGSAVYATTDCPISYFVRLYNIHNFKSRIPNFFLGLRRDIRDADDVLPTVRDRIYTINYSTSRFPHRP